MGTYVGGRLVDRLGRRVIVVGSMATLSPLIVLMLIAGRWPATLLLAGIGFVVIANFSITVVMGQEYLPSRLGLASGITLGAAIGVGGLAAAGLGALADATSLTTDDVDDRRAADPGAADRADAAADRLTDRLRAAARADHRRWISQKETRAR